MTKTMENTMCSSSDDVDDEDYMENTICVLPLMMLMTKTMENTMCSSSDDIDDKKIENTMCSST